MASTEENYKLNRYDSGSGDQAIVGDFVVVTGVNKNSQEYGQSGQVLGFTGAMDSLAIVMFETPRYPNGATAVTWPVVCLTKQGHDAPVDLSSVRMWKQNSFLYNDLTK